jgi:hypothetical protein
MISPAGMTGRPVRNVRLAAERSLTDSKAAARARAGAASAGATCRPCWTASVATTIKAFARYGIFQSWENVPQRLKPCPSRRPGSHATSKTLPSMQKTNLRRWLKRTRKKSLTRFRCSHHRSCSLRRALFPWSEVRGLTLTYPDFFQGRLTVF